MIQNSQLLVVGDMFASEGTRKGKRTATEREGTTKGKRAPNLLEIES
jgi:hypothetical protein